MKKKGLIISTIVMVVVLVASLTTATYAWFSSTATASVQDLGITTTAAQGLQIAMVNGTTANRYSGNLSYSNSAWSGDVEDWGSELNFGEVQIGTMTDAVTKLASGTAVASIDLPLPVVGYKATGAVNTAAPGTPSSTLYLARKVTLDEITDFSYGVHYGVGGAAELTSSATTIAENTQVTKIQERPTDYTSSNTYVVYTIEEATTTEAVADAFYCYAVTQSWSDFLEDYTTGENLNQDIYLVPTGYDASVNPTGYEIAYANSKFYHLTMAVTNMAQTGQIGVSIQVVPTGSASVGAISETKPGMASALRMIVSTEKANASNAARENKVVDTFYPFSAYKLSKATGTMAAGTADAGEYNATFEKHDSTVGGTLYGNYGFLIDDATTIASGAVYYVDVILWVEGTDGECANQTAGTSMSIKIDFGYAASNNSIDWTQGASNGFFGGTNIAASNIIVVESLAQ